MMATLGFFYLQEAIKKTVMLMLVFWVCCLLFFFPVFTLYTVSFISVLWVSFILPLLVFSFSSPSFSLFHPLSPCSLPFVAFIAREDNAVSSDHKV